MGVLSLSGYESAATGLTWATGDQDINALTDNEASHLTDEIDNSSTNYALCDVDISLATAAFTGSDCAIELYLVPSVDGTNYPTWDGNTDTPGDSNINYFVGAPAVSVGTAVRRVAVKDVPLYNGKQKFALRNRTNVTLATGGNTVKYRPHQVMYTA